MDSTYIEVGTWVILRKTYEWGLEKDPYHGKRTRIKYVWISYLEGRRCCRVGCDRGRFAWLPDDMILASDAKLLRSPL